MYLLFEESNIELQDIKSLPNHRVALILIFIALSQTPVYTVRPHHAVPVYIYVYVYIRLDVFKLGD